MNATALVNPEIQTGQQDQLEAMPIHPSVLRLALASLKPGRDLKQALAWIECDAVLSLMLLRLANSSVFAERGQISSLEQAARRLGRGGLEEFLLGLLYSRRSFEAVQLPGYERYFRRCLAMGFLVSALAEDQGENLAWCLSPRLFGLIAGAGRLAFASDREWEGASGTQERSSHERDHAQVSAQWAREAGLNWDDCAVLAGYLSGRGGDLGVVLARAEAMLPEVLESNRSSFSQAARAKGMLMEAEALIRKGGLS